LVESPTGGPKRVAEDQKLLGVSGELLAEALTEDIEFL
jgi:hypothetical protein